MNASLARSAIVRWQTSRTSVFLRTSALEEKAHARALNTMAAPPSAKSVLDNILKRERWHGRGGSWVADAIYGVNDGLGAVFGSSPALPAQQTISNILS